MNYVESTQIRPENPPQLQLWLRLLIAALGVIVLTLMGGAVWIFGLLMFTFSLDGVNGQQLPGWLEPFMLIGWPATIGICAVASPVCFAAGGKWWHALIVFVATALLCLGCYITGVIAVFGSV